MIVTNVENNHAQDFEDVLKKTRQFLLKKGSSAFKKIQADAFEEEVHSTLNTTSKGTIFEGTFEYVGGKYFPDIVSKKEFGFGVEVKKVTTDSWSTLGNSIMESTRVKNIDKVYIFFGKLGNPLDFKFRLYEDCLSDVVISHSPRYQVDMRAGPGQTIFSKMGVSYDELRKSENPFQPIKKYLRDQINQNEEPWWLDRTESAPYTRLWNYLPLHEKKIYRSQMMAFFPQVFGNKQDKFNKPAAWLASRYGVINPSFRDTFTAGGRYESIVEGRRYAAIPRIFNHLQDSVNTIKQELEKAHPGDLLYYLNLSGPDANSLERWIELVVDQGTQFLSSPRNGLVGFPLRSLISEALASGENSSI